MLNKNQIKEYMERGLIKIEPYNEEQLNPNSYDVRLGNWFVWPEWDRYGILSYSKPQYAPDGCRILMDGGDTVLCVTKEVVGCVNGCVAQMKAKSSVGRSGIAVCKDAGLGDIGYVNRWTGELTAFIPRSEVAHLRVGEPFAQFEFHETGMLPKEELYHGQYTENDFPYYMIPKKYRDEWRDKYGDTIEKIKKENE